MSLVSKSTRSGDRIEYSNVCFAKFFREKGLKWEIRTKQIIERMSIVGTFTSPDCLAHHERLKCESYSNVRRWSHPQSFLQWRISTEASSLSPWWTSFSLKVPVELAFNAKHPIPMFPFESTSFRGMSSTSCSLSKIKLFREWSPSWS